jgi:predicted nucleotidyltransferase component of viral defense system
MITTGEIDKLARKNSVEAVVIEKDFVITWVLFGISKHEMLRKILAFKGGTVLKKNYFEDYRYSEDLDFTLMDDKLSNEEILQAFAECLEYVSDESGLTLQLNPDKEKIHKPTGSLKFTINYVAPLKAALDNRYLKVDVTRGETLEFELVERPVFYDYSDIPEDFRIKCYSLSEVLIEKMTAVMGRTIPRDIYDLWYLFVHEGLNLSDHNIEFERKARNKGHDPSHFRMKLEKTEATYKRDWEKSLGNQIKDLPDFKDVMRDLNKHLRKFV